MRPWNITCIASRFEGDCTRTVADVYVDVFNFHSMSSAVWSTLKNNCLSDGLKDILAANLEPRSSTSSMMGYAKTLPFQHIWNNTRHTFRSCWSCHKDWLLPHDPGTMVHHPLVGITDSLLVQTKLSIDTNHEQYSRYFDATCKYRTNQVSHQKVKHVLILPVDKMLPRLSRPKKKGKDMETPAVFYKAEEWAQLSSAQKVSARICRTPRGSTGGSHDCKCQCV